MAAGFGSGNPNLQPALGRLLRYFPPLLALRTFQYASLAARKITRPRPSHEPFLLFNLIELCLSRNKRQ
jgi:hypothetical protein